MESSILNILKTLVNYVPVRHRNWTNVRPIMGWPRKHLYNKGKKYPEPHLYNWRPYLPEDGSYTVIPLPIHKMGGRDMETGRVVVRTLGGGNPKKFRWADMDRTPGSHGVSVLEEEVLMVRYDPLRTSRLALVAGAEKKRWILATEGVKVGDIVRSYSEIPRNPVRAKPGDSHPIGALAVGTKVNQIEIVPGEGGKFCLAAGSCGQITNRSTDSVTVRLPHGDQYEIDVNCQAVVGNMSNVGHANVQLWCPQRRRWLGRRPKSGQPHKKDGYCGRKVKPPKMINATTAARLDKLAKQKEQSMFELS